MIERLKNKILENPAAWILGGLLIFSVYSHWQTGRDFSRACLNYEMMRHGFPHKDQHGILTYEMPNYLGVAVGEVKWVSDKGQKGKIIRWWHKRDGEIKDLCGDRTVN
jgi:hypothetical protein